MWYAIDNWLHVTLYTELLVCTFMCVHFYRSLCVFVCVRALVWEACVSTGKVFASYSLYVYWQTEATVKLA